MPAVAAIMVVLSSGNKSGGKDPNIDLSQAIHTSTLQDRLKM